MMKYFSWRILSAALLSALLFPSCSLQTGVGLPPRVEPEIEAHGIPDDVQKSFSETMRRWTRRAEIYDSMEARVFLAGTLLSPEFIKALEERDSASGSTVSPDIPPSTDCAPSVFLGAYFHEPKLDDLAHRQSIWTLRLVTSSGKTFAPSKIRRITRPDRRLRSSFTFLDKFWVGYAVIFSPLNGDSQSEAPASAADASGENAEASASEEAKTAPKTDASSGESAKFSKEENPVCEPLAWDDVTVTLRSVVGSAALNFAPSSK